MESLVALLGLVVVISGCFGMVSQNCYIMIPDIKINTTITDKYSAFNTIKTHIEQGTFETYGDKISDHTREATINELQYKNVTLPNSTSLEVWVLNEEVGTDSDENTYLRCGPAI